MKLLVEAGARAAHTASEAAVKLVGNFMVATLIERIGEA